MHYQKREDPLYPKHSYPSPAQCSACFLTENKYNENDVIKYLSVIYSKPVRFSSKNGSWSKLSERVIKKENTPVSYFSLTDYGIFVFVYFAIAALLMLVYLNFKQVARKQGFNASLAVLKSLCCSKPSTSKSMV